ncbi:MAG TPA: hypothetical protein VIJ37_06505, partial [Steroidobacteraceae bacterium]
ESVTKVSVTLRRCGLIFMLYRRENLATSYTRIAAGNSGAVPAMIPPRYCRANGLPTAAT